MSDQVYLGIDLGAESGLLSHARTAGELKSLAQMRQMVRSSSDMREFEPG